MKIRLSLPTSLIINLQKVTGCKTKSEAVNLAIQDYLDNGLTHEDKIKTKEFEIALKTVQ